MVIHSGRLSLPPTARCHSSEATRASWEGTRIVGAHLPTRPPGWLQSQAFRNHFGPVGDVVAMVGCTKSKKPKPTARRPLSLHENMVSAHPLDDLGHQPRRNGERRTSLRRSFCSFFSPPPQRFRERPTSSTIPGEQWLRTAGRLKVEAARSFLLRSFIGRLVLRLKAHATPLWAEWQRLWLATESGRSFGSWSRPTIR